MDYFDIHRTNEIQTLSISDILAHEGDTTGLFANRIFRGPPIGDGLPGPLQAISIPFVNGGNTQIKGFDTDVQARFSLGEYGKLNTRFFNTYLKSFLNDNGIVGGPMIEFIAYRIPRNRATATVEWEYQEYAIAVTENYVRGYHVSPDPGIPCTQASLLGTAGVCEVPARATADLNIRYTGVKNLTLNFTVRNLIDKRPPLDPLSRPVNQVYFPYFQGQYFTLAATYRFK